MKSDILSNDQLHQFFHWWVRHRLEPEWEDPAYFVAFIFCIGLRMVEARTLRVDNCKVVGDLFVTVKAAKRKRKDPKTGKPLPIPPDQMYRQADILPQFHPYYLQFLAKRRAAGETWVFPSRWDHSKHIAFRTAIRWWHLCLDAAGIPRIKGSACHRGRRTFASWVGKIPFDVGGGQSAFMELGALKHQLGHTKTTVTDAYYRADLPGMRFPGSGSVTWQKELEKGEGE